ncbi:MAG: hypothetical protein WBF90_21490 [Rivularia sp. (in: cyanobacteria)]
MLFQVELHLAVDMLLLGFYREHRTNSIRIGYQELFSRSSG